MEGWATAKVVQCGLPCDKGFILDFDVTELLDLSKEGMK